MKEGQKGGVVCTPTRIVLHALRDCTRLEPTPRGWIQFL
jgi:hypothetical protein